MYKKTNIEKTSIKVNQSYRGESIEDKINRIVNNKEPIIVTGKQIGRAHV